MDRRALVAAAVVVALALAGCSSAGSGDADDGMDRVGPVDGGDPADGGTAADVTRFEAQFDAIPSDSTETSDWVLMTLQAGPQRPLQGFQWVLEEGQAYEGPGGWTLDMEVAVVAADGQLDELRQVGLLAFRDVGGALDGAAAFSRGVWHEEYRADAAITTVDYGPPWVPGDFAGQFYVDFDSDPTGRSLYFVLAVETARETEIAVAVRAFRDDAEWDAVAQAGDYGIDALVPRAESERPKSLHRLGSGEGFVYPIYIDISFFGGDPGGFGLFGTYAGWTDDVQVAQNGADLRPYGAARQLTLSFDGLDGPGWGRGDGFYEANTGTGQWSADVQVHGSDLTAGGAMFGDLPGYAIDAYWDVAGFYGYFVQDEGDGPSGVTFDLMTGQATGLYEIIVFQHWDLGATLESLLGLPSTSISEVYPPNAPGGQPPASWQTMSSSYEGLAWALEALAANGYESHLGSVRR